MTWAQAIADVYDELKVLASATVTVYDHEPSEGWKRPLAVTVSLGPLTPTDYGVTVRVYSSTATDVKTAQTSLTTLVESVEGTLSSDTPRTLWTTVWMPDDSAWCTSTVLPFPREDF